ncbi:hypothetical protein C1646_752657 [Rhizophagus diaphanus]|nr:hypothetical protein C1646_752657 [Rhizophagus diaphanus] [Rhizophagus sp. MUCL 43196]
MLRKRSEKAKLACIIAPFSNVTDPYIVTLLSSAEDISGNSSSNFSRNIVDQLNNEVGRAVTSGNASNDNVNTESLEDKKTDDFLDEVHKKKIRNSVSSTEIISSCVSLENLILSSAQHLSYLFETAIKSSQQEILDWYNYSFEFESKVDALMTDSRIKDKMARSMIYKEMKLFLPTKITQANLRKKTYKARKHLMLFGKNGIGLDKIKLVSYSVTEILKLINA